MVELDIESFEMSAHPFHILVDVGGIDDEEEIVLAHAVDEQVVHGSTILIAHHAVEDFSVGSPCNIIGEDVVDIALCVRPCNSYLSHVGYVEYATVISYGLMLIYDRRVLDGHVVAAKGRYQSTECHVLVVKACSLVFHIVVC